MKKMGRVLRMPIRTVPWVDRHWGWQEWHSTQEFGLTGSVIDSIREMTGGKLRRFQR